MEKSSLQYVKILFKKTICYHIWQHYFKLTSISPKLVINFAENIYNNIEGSKQSRHRNA